MAINFPSGPSANQEFTTSSGVVYVYNGIAWVGKVTSVTSSGGGGAKLNIFYENSLNVTSNYTISTANNAGTFGPVKVEDGVVITIPDGSTWVVV